MKICVIGLGYIGFPTACVVARVGHHVLGVDVNSDLLHKLNNGGLHIVNEDGLADLAQSVFESGHLRVSRIPETADVFILAVPTPYKILAGKEGIQSVCKESAAGLIDNGRCVGSSGNEKASAVEACSIRNQGYGADLSYVEQATREIVPYVRPGNVIVLESTVSPGTTDKLVRGILEEETGLVCGTDIFIAHAPERVLPGRLLQELAENDRIVGGVDKQSTERAVSFYRTFVNGDVVGTDATTAELVKLMENTYRDVNIALANEFALISEKLGTNVFEAIVLANRHPRVNILTPGPGVGGHCITVDPYFIVEAVPDKARIISLARQINSSMPYHVVSLARSIRNTALESGTAIRKVVALGASYKPNVGDERESPALRIASLLVHDGYQVSIHDPYISRFSKNEVTQLLEGSDLLVMLTDHKVYKRQLDPTDVYRRMRNPFVLDTRGFFGTDWDEAGFYVVRLGVGKRE
ncbi:MAG: nucleotide sugar dehydrogenase [Bacillota bacterium]|jgi:UDP-N-acetyl-D-mannosaminuronic acid dehydrogenase